MADKKTCPACNIDFEITDEDFVYLNKFDVPAPTLCPACREQRRLAFRNERNLHKRKCDLCGRPIISIYSDESAFKIYCDKCWWSDKWNPLEYGQDFDFNKPFFEQFADLMKKVPRLAIINRNSTNSEYTNLCEHNKNSYLLVESSDNEDSLYGYWLQKSQNCVDCSFCHACTLCYECDACENCYNLNFSSNCKNCNDSAFLQNCLGCKNCIGCTNLSQKEFYAFNKPVSKDEYSSILKDALENPKEFIAKFIAFEMTQPRKFAQISQSEDCTGDYIKNSRHCSHCFHADDAEYCRYASHVWRNSKFVMDCDTVGMNSELAYECINTAINSYNNKFCNRCWTVSGSYYCNECDNSSDLFGCIGLNRKKYCVLNKQYDKESFDKLRMTIIEHMRANAEYGEFFPISCSPFSYAESAAQQYYPR